MGVFGEIIALNVENKILIKIEVITYEIVFLFCFNKIKEFDTKYHHGGGGSKKCHVLFGISFGNSVCVPKKLLHTKNR